MLNDRFPYMELDTLADFSIFPVVKRLLVNVFVWWSSLSLYQPSSWMGYNNTKEVIDDIPREKRRLIKSHLPFSLLPPTLMGTVRVVYVVRNSLDVMVSYYHHSKLIKPHCYTGDLPSFAKMVMQKNLL